MVAPLPFPQQSWTRDPNVFAFGDRLEKLPLPEKKIAVPPRDPVRASESSHLTDAPRPIEAANAAPIRVSRFRMTDLGWKIQYSSALRATIKRHVMIRRLFARIMYIFAIQIARFAAAGFHQGFLIRWRASSRRRTEPTSNCPERCDVARGTFLEGRWPHHVAGLTISNPAQSAMMPPLPAAFRAPLCRRRCKARLIFSTQALHM